MRLRNYFIVLFFLVGGVFFGCKSSGGIHNQMLYNNHMKMIKQDKLMRKSMARFRKRSFPKVLKIKVGKKIKRII